MPLQKVSLPAPPQTEAKHSQQAKQNTDKNTAKKTNKRADGGGQRKSKTQKSKTQETQARRDNQRLIYENKAYVLRADSIQEGDRRAEIHAGNRPYLVNCNGEMVRPQLRRSYPALASGTPMIDMLYRIALADLEINVVQDERGAYLRVSPDFPDMIFTRDTAYASYLGACFTHADVIINHLKIDRQLRKELKFKCPSGESIPLEGVQNEPEEISSLEFFNRYGTHAYARRTDDPCWVIGYWAAICALGDRSELAYLIDEFEYFDVNFYRFFFDAGDGLYHGQASFIDIGGTGYPPEYSPQDCMLVKSLSTNCLFVGALDRVARACRMLGRFEQANGYEERARLLRTSIRTQLRNANGNFAYFKGRSGQLQDRREQLGMALAVLLQVVPQSEMAAVLDGYPCNDFGSPTLYPFFHDSRIYHNNAIWPFADVLYHMAVRERHAMTPQADTTLLRAIGNQSRNALWGNFTEVMDYETGGWRFKHARSYIWSAAAWLSLVLHELAGIDASEFDTLSFSPHLPAVLGGRFTLSQLKLGNMTLDIEILGSGSSVRSFVVNGQAQSEPRLRRSPGYHKLLIELDESSR
ncbi:MAG: hypothetical protein NXI32_22995 [bacterium]|nr:hypothetical protein [bacterium]